jgi:hypothetical protein
MGRRLSVVSVHEQRATMGQDDGGPLIWLGADNLVAILWRPWLDMTWRLEVRRQMARREGD